MNLNYLFDIRIVYSNLCLTATLEVDMITKLNNKQKSCFNLYMNIKQTSQSF